MVIPLITMAADSACKIRTLLPGVIMGDLEKHASNDASSEASSKGQPSQIAASDQPEYLNRNPNSDISMLPSLWLFTAIGIPLLILGIRDGWGYLFRSGDAAAFMVGAIVGALVENIIELGSDKPAPLKKLRANLRASSSPTSKGNKLASIIAIVLSYYFTAVLLLYYIMAIIFLVWNAIFSFSDLTVHHPTIDWVQLAAFFTPLCLLPITRFIFTAKSPFPISQMERYLTR
jgi:hypothetical protein